MKFVIRGKWDEEDGFLYWSNDIGWGHFDSATVFDPKDGNINLPEGSTGIRFL